MEMSCLATFIVLAGIVQLSGCASDPPATSDPGATWMKTYGGTNSDVGEGIVQADDGGYYIVGATDLRFSEEPQASLYLIRTDEAGEVVWERTYLGEGFDMGRSILRAGDGGVIIGGRVTSLGQGGRDAYLMKVDEGGDEAWSRTYGTPLDESVTVVRELVGGGFVLVGNLLDPDDFIADAGRAGYGGADRRSSPYLVRTDAQGNELWSRTFDDGTNRLVSGAVSTPDGGVLVVGSVSYFPGSDDDLYLLRVDGDGNELWFRSWEEDRAYGHDLIETADGNYLVTGSLGPAEDTDRAVEDFLFIKVDPEGNELWSRTFGDPGMMDWGYGAVEVVGGGFVAMGTRTEDLHGSPENIVLLKMDESGQLLWEREFETVTHNMFGGLLQLSNGGFAMSGSTVVESGGFDVFLIEADSEGNAVW